MSSRDIGMIGEKYAVEYLLLEGYKILERNFRNRFSEIDIIALDRDILVFIEVKTKTSLKFGQPYEEVTKGKLKKIKRGVQYYLLLRKKYVNYKMRLDVLSVLLNNDKGLEKLKHYKNLDF